jgi:putative radical SAM enzyme (TIGR03279 family)
MSAPRVVAVAPGSPAAAAGLLVGDEIVTVNGGKPRDLIAWRLATDDADLELEVKRGGFVADVAVPKRPGEVLGVEVHSALFDRVRTCDNHCEFCFIHQLPPGMRRSLSLRDDDYRLSFLYGNFTTLTRFNELDLERVITEGLSPLNVSIHATDPEVRSAMLRNRRGGMSLRWLRQLLDHGIEIHGQIVVCPGVNDGAVLDDTLCGIADRFSELASVAVVPLGVSRYVTSSTMRPHHREEVDAVLEVVHAWQQRFMALWGRRMVFAADEYYLLARQPFPPAETYEGFAMHEDGIGMARTFELEYTGRSESATGTRAGFFAWADADAELGTAYRAERAEQTNPAADTSLRRSAGSVTLLPRRSAPVAVLTAPYGAMVLRPLLTDRPDVRIVEVDNRFFGGNVAVTGLMVGADLARVLADQPAGHRYLIPDVCLSEGRFLDDLTPADLPHPVEVIATHGGALRQALEPT